MIRKIGFVVAMQSELMPFMSILGNPNTIGEYNGAPVYSVTYEDKELVIVKSGIGEILAAAATQFLITKYSVDAIFNFGVCGSLTSYRKVKDAVLVNSVAHYEIDTSAIDGYPRGRYSFLDSNLIPINENLRIMAERLSGFDSAICASGNLFVADKCLKTSLNADFGAQICDMESAGIALTCYANRIPCLMVKAVSDADGGAEEFSVMLETATKAYLGLLKDILKEQIISV